MKRIILFLLTNLAIMFVLSIVLGLLSTQLGLDPTGIGAVVLFALVFGMGGALISLAMSKFIAKRSTGAQVIKDPRSDTEHWLINTVRELASTANIGMPEVAVYRGAPNAFATGATRNNSLVAVSDQLMQNMTRAEVRAVLAHEVGHIASGDMVTMTLLQGVMNTLVLLLARIIGVTVDKAVFGTRDGRGIGYFITYIVMQLVLGILASIVVMGFSRRREFAADATAAKLLGSPRDMIAALQRLGSLEPGALPQSMKAFGITGAPKWAALFASHPPLEKRIERLERA
ncbi:protease HtpX [Myxococcota bacterium]|jgi:heat shock protein HtpX|nr:protease HtpX [Myxococcota bacterium]MBP8970620.1 protease HtpX [Myxococcota bacterium]HHW97386.1 protease HtpX [Oligoflexales bacterium]